MKKFLSILLALAMLLTVTSAFAELSNYVTVGLIDPDGNEAVITDEWPVLVFCIDGAEDSNVCAFGTEEEVMTGTYEFGEADEEYVEIIVTLEDGSQISMIFSLVDDVFMYVDDEGYTFVMVNVGELEDAA